MDRDEAMKALELLRRVVGQARDETTLENWGVVWILHGITNCVAFTTTNVLLWKGYATPPPFVALWGGVMTLNFILILAIKSGGAGVRTFVENQIWLIWTTFIAAVALTAILNYVMGLAVIFTGPVIAILAAVAFSAMGGVMGRRWFAFAAVFAGAAVATALLPEWQFVILGALWLVVQLGAGIHLLIEKRRRLGAGPRLV